MAAMLRTPAPTATVSARASSQGSGLRTTSNLINAFVGKSDALAGEEHH